VDPDAPPFGKYFLEGRCFPFFHKQEKHHES
jgi:hypothetical protein